MWSLLEHWISIAGPELLVPPSPEADAGAASEAKRDLGAPPCDSVAELDRLAAEARTCAACPLHADRTQAVFSDGRADARILFVGEGPGRDEDREGVPFVGRAGRLLTNIIQGAMGLPRGDVYIADVVKCRPPGNRNPEPSEQAACAHFLESQIRLVGPEVLIALGSVAAHFLVETPLSVTRMRGRVWDYRGIPLIVTWHPAYLLRNPSAKQDCWSDIKMALRVLGLSDSPAPWRPDRKSP